jgi:DNA-binding SARP family transcriptional activator/predicted ATPase
VNSSNDPHARPLAGSAALVHPLSVRLLGGLRLAGVREGDATGYESRHHVRAVLALAGSSSHGMLRDEMVELLWPNSRAEAARNRLYHTVHLARQALAVFAWDDEWLVVRNGRVLFDERVWCDVHELERAVETGVADLGADPLHAALTHCHADWVPGLEIGSASEAVRVRVRGFQAALLREAIGRHAPQGDTPAQRELLQNLIRVQATDEWAYRELMRLDLGAGRRHAVLRTFEAVSRELTIRLGLRPTAETCAVAALASAELQDPAGRVVPEPGAAVFSTVGREPLIQDLVAQLGGACGLWNVTGLSGIGKTAVVREVIRRLAPTLSDGVHVVSMGDMVTGTSAVAACARAIGLASSGRGDELEPLVRALELRQMLLFIDDLDAASDVERLLASLPFGSMQSRLIVTSRARVEQRSAIHVVVPALTVPLVGASKSQAGQCAAFALFQLRCPVASHEQDSDAWHRDAVRLVRRLDGLPLAIELAALRTMTMTPGEILLQIERGLRPLGDGPSGMQRRHRSLQASLDWSVQLLGKAARNAYGAASVFPGGFGRADMAPLMAAVGLAAGVAGAALDELAAAGLLVREAEGARLRMLHLPRAHARAQAVERGQWPALLSARLQDVCQQLEENALEFESPTYAARLPRVIALEEDTLALLEFAQATDPARFVRLLIVMFESWGGRGIGAMVLRWAEPAIACARKLNLNDEELCFRTCLSNALVQGGRFAEAEAVDGAIALLLPEVSNVVWAARAASSMAGGLVLAGHATQAADLLHDTLKKRGLGVDDAGYWTIHMRLLVLRKAPEGVEIDPLTLRGRFMGSPLWLLMLRGLCEACEASADWRNAVALAEELIGCARALRSQMHEVIGNWYRASSLFALDAPAQALQNYDEGCRLSLAAGWEHIAADSRVVACCVHWRLLELDAAQRCLNEATGLLGGKTATHLVAEMPLHRSVILFLKGQVRAAVREFLLVPEERMQREPNDTLSLWAEAGALLALGMGLPRLGAELARTLRRLDTHNDLVPAVGRFRDQQFGPIEGSAITEPDSGSELRERIVSSLRELIGLLAQPETAATEAPGFATRPNNPPA